MDGRGGRRHALSALCTVILGNVIILAVLDWAGRGPLATPSLAAPAEWAHWMNEQSPLVSAFSVLRLMAMGASWYLLASAVIGVLARLAFAPRSVIIAFDRMTVPGLRRLLAVAVAGGTLALRLGGGASAAAGPAAVAVAAQVGYESDQEGTPPTTVVMHRLSATEATPAATAPSSPPAPPPAPPESWTVKPGQCFWSIAEEVLRGALGRDPSDGEVVPYWLRLIERNRNALRDPANPDLIYPGQVFSVPPAGQKEAT